MNRLQKKAWKDFWTICVMTILGLSGFGFLTYADVRGVRYLIAFFYPTCVMAGWIVVQNSRKNKRQNIPQFDEREFYLIQRAIHWGNNCFMGYILIVMGTAFTLVGGRGKVAMWSISFAFFCGIFLSGTVQSLVLMRYAREDDKNMEGGDT
ncbi:MAG: hypothetical protein JRI91_15960 [Deltaproteobacteria bacterium]|nr:hypothetical protein [Deltaproteobacteria bacterium]